MFCTSQEIVKQKEFWAGRDCLSRANNHELNGRALSEALPLPPSKTWRDFRSLRKSWQSISAKERHCGEILPDSRQEHRVLAKNCDRNLFLWSNPLGEDDLAERGVADIREAKWIPQYELDDSIARIQITSQLHAYASRDAVVKCRRWVSALSNPNGHFIDQPTLMPSQWYPWPENDLVEQFS